MKASKALKLGLEVDNDSPKDLHNKHRRRKLKIRKEISNKEKKDIYNQIKCIVFDLGNNFCLSFKKHIKKIETTTTAVIIPRLSASATEQENREKETQNKNTEDKLQESLAICATEVEKIKSFNNSNNYIHENISKGNDYMGKTTDIEQMEVEKETISDNDNENIYRNNSNKSLQFSDSENKTESSISKQNSNNNLLLVQNSDKMNIDSENKNDSDYNNYNNNNDDKNIICSVIFNSNNNNYNKINLLNPYQPEVKDEQNKMQVEKEAKLFVSSEISKIESISATQALTQQINHDFRNKQANDFIFSEQTEINENTTALDTQIAPCLDRDKEKKFLSPQVKRKYNKALFSSTDDSANKGTINNLKLKGKKGKRKQKSKQVEYTYTLVTNKTGINNYHLSYRETLNSNIFPWSFIKSESLHPSEIFEFYKKTVTNEEQYYKKILKQDYKKSDSSSSNVYANNGSLNQPIELINNAIIDKTLSNSNKEEIVKIRKRGKYKKSATQKDFISKEGFQAPNALLTPQQPELPVTAKALANNSSLIECEDKTLYCYCKKRTIPGEFMIGNIFLLLFNTYTIYIHIL